MWFKFPQGCDRVSVERQDFTVEITQNGDKFFRAPAHFAGKLLSIPGFTSVNEQDLPVGSPEDLPKADPLRDTTIVELTKSNEAFKTTVQNLRMDLNSLSGKYNSLLGENAELKHKLTEAESKIQELLEIDEDAEKPLPQKVVAIKK